MKLTHSPREFKLRRIRQSRVENFFRSDEWLQAGSPNGNRSLAKKASSHFMVLLV
jgi:hypothetical protein